jgi:aminoglycoside phosphotransferase family enzyme
MSTESTKCSVADKVSYLASGLAFHPADRPVTVIETHTSWVFMGRTRVLKMKKPIQLPFLDFRTLASRRRNTITETRLNRRLAPDVYRDPVALHLRSDGQFTLSAGGEIVEWLVDMRRLPHSDMLDQRIRTHRLHRPDILRLARYLADFYAGLPAVPDGELYLRHLAVEQKVSTELLLDPRLGLDAGRLAPLFHRFNVLLNRCLPEIRRRIEEGRISEGHGDLRPCHICLLDPPVAFDCLEFDRSMRLIDPIDEVTLLGLECAVLGARWVRDVLVTEVSKALGDFPTIQLGHTYGAFRALLRARLCAAHLLDDTRRDALPWLRQTKRYLTIANREITSANAANARPIHPHVAA